MVKLNLMCGTILLPGWTNCDIVEPYDVYSDVTQPLPFDGTSVDSIVCYHGMEHLVYPEEVNTFLQECHRVLKSNGDITIAVPDLIGVVIALRDGGEVFQLSDLAGDRLFHNLLFGTHERDGHWHKWMYTEHTLKYVIARHFRDVFIEKHSNDHGGAGLLARGVK